MIHFKDYVERLNFKQTTLAKRFIKPNKSNETKASNDLMDKQEFLKWVNKEIIPQLIKYEATRKVVMRLSIILPIVIAIALFLVLPTIVNHFNSLRDSAAKLWLSISTLAIYAGYRKRKSFKNKVKNKITPQFLARMGNLSHKQNSITLALIKESLALDFSCIETYKFETDDQISGTFSNTSFSVLECLLTPANSDIHLSKLGVPVDVPDPTARLFKGVIIDIPLAKYLYAQTLLLHNSQSRRGMQKVTLEDADFMMNYHVLSTDQIEARVLLTPTFMEKLNQLKTIFKGNKIDVSFFANHALFFIYTSKDLFESYTKYQSITNPDTYATFYDHIKAIKDMIDLLNINNSKIINEPENTKVNPVSYTKITKAEPHNWISMIITIALLIILFLYIASR